MTDTVKRVATISLHLFYQNDELCVLIESEGELFDNPQVQAESMAAAARALHRYACRWQIAQSAHEDTRDSEASSRG